MRRSACMIGLFAAAASTAAATDVSTTSGVLGLTRLVSARLGLVTVTAPAPPGTLPPPRLLATTSTGARFEEIGPRLPRDTVIDDAFFLDRRLGWVVAWSTDRVVVNVYRTGDGGQTWKRTSVTTHSAAAGSVATIQFVGPRRGWLVNQQPTAPNATLFATADGGATWNIVPGDLPMIAPVLFAGPHEAWQAGGPFDSGLAHSTDGGRHWTRVRLPRPPGQRSAEAEYDMPAIFGRTVEEPVTFLHRGRAALAVYRSDDRGRSWKLASVLAHAGAASGGRCFGLRAPLPVSLAAPGSWWVGAYRAGAWLAYRTRNAGKRWQTSLVVRSPRGRSCSSRELQAVDGRTAWFTTPSGRTGNRLFATSDGGAHWRRLVP